MIKNTIIALGTVAALIVGAAPAFANADNRTDPVFQVQLDRQNSADNLVQAKQNVTTLLAQRGIKATDVDEWGGYVRADVTQPDGSQAVRFFQPGTLEPVSIDQLR